jgi:hypothetical protein
MSQRNTFPRLLLTLILLTVVCASLFAPNVEDVEAKPNKIYPATSIVISEFRTRGPNGASDEFVELYNPTSVSISIGNWQLRVLTGTGLEATRATITAGTILSPGQYYLIANNTAVTGYSGSTTPNQTYTTGIVDAGGIAIFDNLNIRIDSVGLNTNYPTYTETIPLPTLTLDINQSYERYIGGVNGNCQDDGNNLTDFALVNPSTPQNFSSAFVLCGTPTSTPSPTNTSTSTNTPTNTSTSTNTPPFSLTPSLTPAPGEVIISEVAWSGTIATTNDEWIELYNTRSTPIDITGWRLVSDSGSVDIVLNGIIPANGFFLLERARELTVSDVTANQIYTGAMSDAGEILRLSRPSGVLIDTANSDGGSWPAGTASSTFYSMERLINGSVVAADTSSGWVSNNQPASWIAHDANNNLIHGTPGLPNFNFISTITPTLTATITSTPTRTPTGSLIRSVVINEIAWAGTVSGLADDEWIELYNPGSTPINITGWRLVADDGTPNISLVGTIPANGYFLLERGETLTDNTTVSDIAADQIYTGNALSNSGEDITLYDTSNKVIDTANGNGGAWPAGSSSTYGTMERILNTADSDSAWVTNNGTRRNGLNANGGNILGTPKNSNTVGPTPTATIANRTSTPTLPAIDPRPIINEILPRPGFDWNQDGRIDVFDEFIEIKNLTAIDITLNGWKLDKGVGSTAFPLPNVTLKPNERIVFYSLETNLLLSDGGETIRLINSRGTIYDAYTYTVAKAEDKSFCRLPDGNVYNGWFDDCIPTPSQSNTREGNVPTSPNDHESSVCNLPDTIPNDFFFAECNGYGKNIWNPSYWGELYRMFIESNTSKWETFFE